MNFETFKNGGLFDYEWLGKPELFAEEYTYGIFVMKIDSRWILAYVDFHLKKYAIADFLS